MHDNYINIEKAHFETGGIVVRLHVHFLNEKPNLAVKCELWDADSGKILDSEIWTVEQQISAVFDWITHPVGTSTKGLIINAGFLWLDEQNGMMFDSVASQVIGEGDTIIECLIDVEKPRAADKKLTKLGYFRSGNYDYFYPNTPTSAGKTKVMAPFKGVLNLNSDEWEIDSIADGALEFFPAPELNMFVSNGGSVSYRREMISQLHIAEGKKQLAWDFNDDWNDVFYSNVIASNTILNFYFRIFLRLRNLADPDLYRYQDAIVSSIPFELGELSSEALIEPILLLYGCLAENTLITMDDSSEKLVSQIEVGQHVLTTEGIAVVVDVVAGPEPKLVCVETAEGAILRMSDAHPVKTRRGFVRADHLNAADVLLDKDGSDTPIRYLYTEEYHGKVYNLKTSKPNTGLIANGMVVGDFDMQNTLVENAARTEYSPVVCVSRQAFTEIAGAIERVSVETIRNILVQNADVAGNTIGSGLTISHEAMHKVETALKSMFNQ